MFYSELVADICLVHFCSFGPFLCVLFHLQLLFGVAEVFGTELAKSKRYNVGPRSKIAIFTWFGCTIRVSSHCLVILPCSLVGGWLCLCALSVLHCMYF